METRTRKGSLVWAGFLILLGLMLVVQTFVGLSAWVWVAALAAAGLAAYATYSSGRSEKGLLILAYVLWVVALLVALITLNVLQDEWIATYVLLAIALPFLVAFLRDREQWGMLIPAYILLAVAVMVRLMGAGALSDLLIPAYVMFAIAIPFFAVYARDPKQWWPLIPAAILAVIGLSFLIAEAAVQYIAAAALILVGVGILMRQFSSKEPREPDVPTSTGAEEYKPPEE